LIHFYKSVCILADRNQRMDDQESDQRKADLDSEDDHICADFASEVNRKLIEYSVDKLSRRSREFKTATENGSKDRLYIGTTENRSKDMSQEFKTSMETRNRKNRSSNEGTHEQQFSNKEMRRNDSAGELQEGEGESGVVSEECADQTTGSRRISRVNSKADLAREERRQRRRSGKQNVKQEEEGKNMVQKLTQTIISRVSSFFPIIGSFSRHSSDSGIQSLPPSRSLSRRSSIFSLGSYMSEASDSEDEFLSHVKVVPGGNIKDDYKLLELLGEGAFSKVYLAESIQDKGGLAAVKVINKAELCRDEDKMFLVEKEIEIMSQLDHPNIVKLYEVYVNSEEVCLVMELAKGGEVFDKLIEFGSLSEPVSAKLVLQVLEAVSYLHSLGIVHRDLKPENLLFYDNKTGSKVMVSDFGLSDYDEELSSESPVCGTATYLAPEVVKRTCSTQAQDMWSLGVISYIILCGYPPFFRDNKKEGDEAELLRQIARGKYKFHPNFWDDISLEAKDFVRGLMNTDPDARLTAEEAIHHPWIQNSTKNFFTETLWQSVMSGFLILSTLLVCFYMYFYVLSQYFNLQYSLVTKVASSSLDWIQSIGEGFELMASGYRSVSTLLADTLTFSSSYLPKLRLRLLNILSD